jgi:hypothetical protein
MIVFSINNRDDILKKHLELYQLALVSVIIKISERRWEEPYQQINPLANSGEKSKINY